MGGKSTRMIPFVDLKAQYLSIKSEIDTAVLKTLETTQFILGPEVAALEEEFAAHCQARFAVGLNSGTSALHLALLAAGIGPGDEVITVPFTFVATVAAIVYAGAKPVFVDIDPKSYTMDVTQLQGAITKRTKAILPVHLYGQPADMDPIIEVAKRNGVLVIEDAAQAHGAEYKGHRVGSIGDIGCFSFYPGKNLGACGEAGTLVSNNPEYAKSARMFRDWGQARKYDHVLKGYNYRMEGIQGAILRVKLRHLDNWTEARRRHAKKYNEVLKDSPSAPGRNAVCPSRLSRLFAAHAATRGFAAGSPGAGNSNGHSLPDSGPFAKGISDRDKANDFPVSEQIAREVISLPMYAELSDKSIETISTALHEAELSYEAK